MRKPVSRIWGFFKNCCCYYLFILSSPRAADEPISDAWSGAGRVWASRKGKARKGRGSRWAPALPGRDPGGAVLGVGRLCRTWEMQQRSLPPSLPGGVKCEAAGGAVPLCVCVSVCVLVCEQRRGRRVSWCLLPDPSGSPDHCTAPALRRRPAAAPAAGASAGPGAEPGPPGAAAGSGAGSAPAAPPQPHGAAPLPALKAAPSRPQRQPAEGR